MKRRAQMNGIRVGVFEEAENRDAVRRFFKAREYGDGQS